MALSSRRQGLCVSPSWSWWRWGDTRVKRCVMVFPEVYNAGEKKPCGMGTGVRQIRGWEILAVPKYGQISKMWNSVAIREKVALTTFMLVSSPLTVLLTTVWLEIQRWLYLTGLRDFKSSLDYYCSRGAPSTAVASFKHKSKVKSHLIVI